MKAKQYFFLLVTILFALSCDKDEYFDEFEVDISVNGDLSKFDGSLYIISYHQDGSILLVSSEEGNNTVSDGLGSFAVNDVGLNRFYTSTYIESIDVRHFFSLTQEASQEENWRDFTLTVIVTVRRNGSEIDNVTMVYGGESNPSGFDESYSVN